MAGDPVLSLEAAKLHLRTDGDDEDELILDAIDAAQDWVENYTGLVLTPRTITETAPQLGRWIELSSWPVSEITAIRYPVAGVLIAMDAAIWAVSYARRPVRILPVAWGWGIGLGAYLGDAAALPVEIDVSAGFATEDDVPRVVLQAMKLLVSHFYTNRTPVLTGTQAAAVTVPFSVEALLRKWRRRIC